MSSLSSKKKACITQNTSSMGGDGDVCVTTSSQERSQSSNFLAEKIRMATRGRRGRQKTLPEEYGCGNEQPNEQYSAENSTIGSAPDVVGVHEEPDEVRPGVVAVAGIDALEMSRAWESHFDTFQQLDPEQEEEKTEILENQHDANDQDSCASGSCSQPVAVVVDEDEWEKQVRDHILHDAARAEIISSSDSTTRIVTLKRRLICSTAIIMFVLVAVTVSFLVWFFLQHGRNDSIPSTLVPSMAPTIILQPTLEAIVSNGVLRCAVSVQGFDVETKLCQAIAAAIFGDSSRFKKVMVEPNDPYEALTNMSVDVAAAVARISMDNMVFQKESKVGFSFSYPWYYGGYSFGGHPEFLKCADRLDGFFGKCNELRICVGTNENYNVVRQWFPSYMIRLVPYGTMHENLEQGICNVISGERISVSEESARKSNYTRPFQKGKIILSKMLTGVATRKDDTEFSDFVKWVIQALFVAEARNISRSNANEFGITTQVFGTRYENMFINAIAAVGNSGNIWEEETYFENSFRSDIMKLNNGSTGLIYSYAFGEDIDSIGPAPQSGSIMYNILKQGYLRCGVLVETHVWTKLGIQYCKALAASLFQGDFSSPSRIEFINVTSYTQLDKGEVDVISGDRITLEKDVQEPTTKKGFTFSLPYFYDDNGLNTKEHPHRVSDSIAMVTAEDDTQWSDYVFWMVSATIYAEERGIHQNISFDMPLINLFGADLQAMYRYAISAVGNYGDMYSQTIDTTRYPRTGRNLLNNHHPPGPQINPSFWEV